jgi:hypothetical protein
MITSNGFAEITSSMVSQKRHNGGLQLRRTISIQAEGKKLLEKHAIAPSAARLCYAAWWNQVTAR